MLALRTRLKLSKIPTVPIAIDRDGKITTKDLAGGFRPFYATLVRGLEKLSRFSFAPNFSKMQHPTEDFPELVFSSDEPYEKLCEFCEKLNVAMTVNITRFSTGIFASLSSTIFQRARFVAGETVIDEIALNVVAAMVLSDIGLYEIVLPPTEEEIVQAELEGVAKKGLDAAMMTLRKFAENRPKNDGGNTIANPLDRILSLGSKSTPSEILESLNSVTLSVTE